MCRAEKYKIFKTLIQVNVLILFQSQALQEPDDAVFTEEPGMRLSCFKSYVF